MEFKIIKLVLCLTSLCGAFLSFPVSSEIRNESPVRLANKKIAYAESDISKSLGFSPTYVSQIPANNQLPKNSFLTDEKPYSIENTQAVSNKIISLSKQFDADAVQVSSVPEFSLNNENCAEADASSFQNVLEDNTAFPTMESKIQYFKSNLKERKYDADVSTPKEDNTQNVIEDESSKDIHIFVPGIFGTSSHWSNDGENPSENQGFVQSKFPHCGAYEDLANSELEYQNRKK